MKPGGWTAGALFGALLLALLLTTGAEERFPARSVRSRAPEGRRAAFVLLRRLGWQVEAWERSPGSLPNDGSLLWLPRVAEGPRTSGDSEAAGDRPGPRHARAAYRTFIEGGGTLVLAASPAAARFLESDLDLGPVADSSASKESALVPLELATAADERLALDWPRDDTLLAFAGLAGARPRWPTLAGRPLALEWQLGRGRLLLLGWDGFLDNERIASADNALFCTRVLEDLGRERPLRFDEYALGRGQGGSPLAIAFGPRLRPLVVQLLLFGLLWLWRQAWVREFPRDPAALEWSSPLARARALATLYLSARRVDRLRELLVDGVLARLTQRAPAPAAAGPAGLAARLGPLAGLLDSSTTLPDLERRLGSEARTESDLERVHLLLRELEVRAGRARGAAATRGPGP